jgi:hypothetical protein
MTPACVSWRKAKKTQRIGLYLNAFCDTVLRSLFPSTDRVALAMATIPFGTGNAKHIGHSDPVEGDAPGSYSSLVPVGLVVEGDIINKFDIFKDLVLEIRLQKRRDIWFSHSPPKKN